MGFATEAKAESEAALKEARIAHALKIGRRYLRFCREANGANAARYTIEEYLKLQGVRPLYIPEVARMLKERYAAV